MGNAQLNASGAGAPEDSTRDATYSECLSRFVTGLDFGLLPAETLASAKRHLLDTLGVAIAGSRQEMAMRALCGIGHIAGCAGGCGVWGTSRTLAAPYAAMANSVAAHVLDYDDTHTDSITHGSAVLAPAVLALAEEAGASGTDLIAAFVAGWEVAARVGLAARGSFHKRGFHTTSVAGVFGATAAAARLLCLNPEQTTHAFGLAGSQVCGVSEYLSNGSSSKSFHPGWAAFSGIVAANLARAGMTGPATVFEGRYGTFRSYGIIEECDLNALVAELGQRWETARISIKPYPCCHFAHAFVDCVLELRRQGITPDQVESLHCVVPQIELPLICEPFQRKLRPDSPYAAKFSLPFLLAAALAEGNIDHGTFTSEHIGSPDLLALAERVSYRAAKPGETTFPRYFPGWVEAKLKGGRTLTQRLDINRGNPDNPLPQTAVEEKFRANAQGVLTPAATDAVIAAASRLEQGGVAELARALRAG